MTPLIVAEMSANHLGSLDRAMAIVDAAAEAGANAIKLQTWAPDTMCLDRSYTLQSGPWAGRKLFDLYREAYTPWEWHRPIFDRARSKGLIPFSAAFDRESVDFLETLGVDRHKVASFELTDLPLIRYAARTGKPLIMSTGMASVAEITAAYAAANSRRITLLKCTSAYPATVDDANLATIPDMRQWLGCDVGLSDHTPGHEVAAAAAALGATIIEKHLTLSRADEGPDAGFSMEPDEFAAMVKACRTAAAARGAPHYGCTPSESTALRRSLYIARDMKAGEMLTADNLRTARPACGLPPAKYQVVLGQTIKQDAMAGAPLTMELLA
jgi:pseudaminic acid synthase